MAKNDISKPGKIWRSFWSFWLCFFVAGMISGIVNPPGSAEAENDAPKFNSWNAIDEAAKKAGYGGSSNKNIVRLIYETQKNGGLEKHLRKVVGCLDADQDFCNKWYPKVKAVQILDEGLLYLFSEFGGDEYVEFMIYVYKEPGKIYQEGQSLENTFYVFEGMFSYLTVLGASRSVPAFGKADFTPISWDWAKDWAKKK